MCCRYYVDLSPELRPIIEAANRSPLAERMKQEAGRELKTAGEIRPTDAAPVLARARNGHPSVFPMIWGYTGRTRVFNARSETAASLPMFRESWRLRRCVIPAIAYFEWEHLPPSGGKRKTGDRFRIRSGREPLIYMAGLYRMEESLPHFTILTREAAEGIRFIHDRMPVLLSGPLAEEWIRPDCEPEQLLSRAGAEAVPVFERETETAKEKNRNAL